MENESKEQRNRITKAYRASQFQKVSEPYLTYAPKVKVIKPNGETNWMDITEEELTAIKKILCEN